VKLVPTKACFFRKFRADHVILLNSWKANEFLGWGPNFLKNFFSAISRGMKHVEVCCHTTNA
jgi:hypothetical protein